MMYLLDTDTCIYLINQHPKMVPQAALDACGISVVVKGELLYGCELANSPDATYNFVQGITQLDLTPDVADHYGSIRAHLKKNGQMIGPNDLWIAAHALALNATLVSNNQREFERVPELTLQNWMLS